MRKSVLAAVVAVMVVSATSATAASLITSKQIKDGTIQNRDIKRGTISANRLSATVQRQLRLAGATSNSAASSSAPAPGRNGTNGVNGANGAPGAKGADGANGANGANGENADGTTTERVRTLGQGGFANTSFGDSSVSIAGGKLNLAADTATKNSVAQLTKTFSPSKKVADLELLKYTYGIDGREGGAVAPLVRLSVIDARNAADTGTATTDLVFEPVYTDDTPNGGEINALTGMWWSSKPIKGATNNDTYIDGIQSLQSLLNNNPNMKVTSMTIEAGMDATGSPWKGFTGSVSQLSLGFAGDDDIRYVFGN